MRTAEPRSAARAEPAVAGYRSVPLAGLAADAALPFALHLRTADDTWILYRQQGERFDESHLGRLQAEGIGQLYLADADRGAYCRRVEAALDRVLLDRAAPLEQRVEVLHGVATAMAEDLLAGPDRATLQRAQRTMLATSGLLLRETQGFAALRKLLTASRSLVQHSLTVGFLTMGLCRILLSPDGATMAQAGLAGLLHDIGKVGHEDLDHDPEHTTRGAELLQSLGVPRPVVEAARSHHERWDGSGFPQGLRGPQVPELARLVGLVNTFDKVYSGQTPRVGVFDALRILAQAYRGCFEDRLALGLVQLFR